MIGKAVLAAAALAFATTAASAVTFTVTEGNGDNRARIAGSEDLEDAPGGSPGFDLDNILGGPFGTGETIGIYGRIVGAVDKFSYSFSSGVNFDVKFDFDGYDLAGGGSVAPGLSGLVDQSVVTGNGNPAEDGGGKKVIISLLNTLTNAMLSKTYFTNVTSLTALTDIIFDNVESGSYVLTVDGSKGNKKKVPALYDIEITAVPLPAGAVLLLSGLGVLGVARMRRKA